MNLSDEKLLHSWLKVSYSSTNEPLLNTLIQSRLEQNGTHVPSYGCNIPYSLYKVGDPIGERWIILDSIGRGNFFVVYLALDKIDHELVAVKTIRNDIYIEEKQNKQLYTEAIKWINIDKHPNILEAKKIEDLMGQLFISMEFILPQRNKKGSSLREYIKIETPLQIELILKWSIQLCFGMIHANRCGIQCHLDIKPENILIDRENTLKITDFGLANGISGIGTWQYMAPEQFDPLAEACILNDIYSFGIVLFEMATGHLPFTPDPFRYINRSNSLRNAWRKSWEEAHRYSPVPEIGKPFGSIIKKCLEKDRERRFRNFEELIRELTKIARKLKITIDEPVIRPLSLLDICGKGEQFIALGLFEEAINLFNQVLDRDPDNPKALNGKGISLFFISFLREAIDCFEKVLAIHPKDVTALIGKGLCLRKLERFEEANKCFNKALEVQPNLPLVNYQVAESWLDKGFPERARDYYFRTVQSLLALKRKEEALEVISKALNRFPRAIWLLQLEAWSHRVRGDMEDEKELIKSQQVLRELTKGENQEGETLGILAGTYKRLWKRNREKYNGHLRKAFELYNKAWRDSGHTNTYVGINLATISLLIGKIEESRNIALEIIKIYRQRELNSLIGQKPFSNYWDRVTLAEAELIMGRLGKARRLYKDIMNLYREKLSYIESSMEQINLILPEIGLSINAEEFLKASSRVPRARRICLGIIGQRKINSITILEEKLKKVLQKLKQELPKNIQFEIISSLAVEEERLGVKIFLYEPDTIFRIVLPLQYKEYIQDFSDNKSVEEFKNFLNQAEEIIYLTPVKNRNEAYRNAGRYILDHCDALIVLWNGEPASGIGETAEIVTFGKERGLPLIWINTKYPFKVTFENLEKLKKKTFIKGEFNMYKPKPIDTSHVQLSDDLFELTELLAENNHDHWALMRIKEGWKWGPERDDVAKTNPDLVPYNELPESEKEYDRRNALETLKTIIALGYKIEKK